MFARRHAPVVATRRLSSLPSPSAWPRRGGKGGSGEGRHRAVQGFRITQHLADLLLFNFYDEVKQLQARGSEAVDHTGVTISITFPSRRRGT